VAARTVDRLFRESQKQAGSIPVRQDLLGLHNLLGGTGKIKLQFAGSASDLDPDGVQAAVLHSQAELFVNFPDTMALKAIAHG